MALAAPFFHASCTSTDEGDGDDEELADEELSEKDEAEAAAKKAAGEGGLPLPEKPTAWHTRTLVATRPQPAPDRVFGCIEKVAAIAKEAGNQQAMLEAQAQTANLAAADAELYHYCFLQMMVKLDDRIVSGGALMTDRAGAFLDGMKALWILARGLDVAQGRSRYFEYLRARYVQLSQDHFGRDIEVVGPAMAPLR